MSLYAGHRYRYRDGDVRVSDKSSKCYVVVVGLHGGDAYAYSGPRL
jgi:hypothetical protein